MILKVKAAIQCTAPCEHVHPANICISMVCVGLPSLCQGTESIAEAGSLRTASVTLNDNVIMRMVGGREDLQPNMDIKP
jgi:hypothetical protein